MIKTITASAKCRKKWLSGRVPIALGPLHRFHSQQITETSILYSFLNVSLQVRRKSDLHDGLSGCKSWYNTVPLANLMSTQCVKRPPRSLRSRRLSTGLRIHPRNEWKIYENLDTRREGHIVLKFELKNISIGFIENKKLCSCHMKLETGSLRALTPI